MLRPLVLFSLLAQVSAAPGPPRDGFVLLTGGDTIAVERFARAPGQLEGELSLRGAGLRIQYAVRYAPDGAPTHVTSRVFRGAEAGEPLQSGEITFAADSAMADVRPGGVQRFACPRGAQPYLNPSMAMIEQAVRTALAGGGAPASVNFFLLSGGQVLPAAVARLGADSVTVALGGVEMRFAVDAAGRLMGGWIPAQGVLVTRFSGEAAPLSGPPADYSAPAGAPWTAEDVRVPCAGFALAGTLTVPRGAVKPMPCVLMITGSGLEDRDEAIPGVAGYRPFRQFAEAFAKAGIATLRLDDRGYGASGGDPSRATSADFANDARAALAWLRSQPGIDAGRLALAGHSEGGLIAPMIAADDSGVAAIVLMAAPAWTGRRVIASQNRDLFRKGARVPPVRVDSIVRAAMTRVNSLAESSPWLREFLDYDPLPAARRVTCPVLVVQGSTDRQVDPRQAAELAAAIREGGNARVAVQMIEGANHLFLPDPDGDPRGYAALREKRIRQPVLEGVARWLAGALRR